MKVLVKNLPLPRCAKYRDDTPKIDTNELLEYPIEDCRCYRSHTKGKPHSRPKGNSKKDRPVDIVNSKFHKF